MKQVFQQMHTLLRTEKPAYIVVGNNHTYAGGERVEIETASMLADLAEDNGFILRESDPDGDACIA